MAKRKRNDSLGFRMPARDIVVGASIFGIGASVVARTGGPTAGISAAASFLPVLGTTIGSGLALQHLRRLQGRTKRKR